MFNSDSIIYIYLMTITKNSPHPGQNGHGDIFKCIFADEKFVFRSDRFHWSLFPRFQLIAFVHMMAWRWICDKPDDPIHWHLEWHIYASLRGWGVGGVGGGGWWGGWGWGGGGWGGGGRDELYIHIFAGALEGPMQTLVGTVKSCEHVALWNCCIRSLLMIHVISFKVELLRRLSKCYSIHNKDQSWHLTNDPSCMVQIIVIRNDAFGQQYLAIN